MQNKKQVIPQMIAVGFRAMLETLPDGMLIDPETAYEALEKFGSRPDNQDVSALSDMLVMLKTCVASELPDDFDEDALVDAMKTHTREQLNLWQSNRKK